MKKMKIHQTGTKMRYKIIGNFYFYVYKMHYLNIYMLAVKVPPLQHLDHQGQYSED